MSPPAHRRHAPLAPAQLSLPGSQGRGGRRPGAGHPKTGRTKVAHRSRPRVTRHTPVHVTLKVRPDLPNLRRGAVFRLIRGVLREVCDGDAFRVCHFTVQATHVHLVCEATEANVLAAGLHRLALRVVKRVNAALDRHGRVFAERYHARVLATPREVKNALRYVLLNGRKHAAQRGQRIGPDWFDPCSSAAWFDGWSKRLPWREPWMRALRSQAPATAPARSWLLSIGWREKCGPLSLHETPGPRPEAT